MNAGRRREISRNSWRGFLGIGLDTNHLVLPRGRNSAPNMVLKSFRKHIIPEDLSGVDSVRQIYAALACFHHPGTHHSRAQSLRRLALEMAGRLANDSGCLPE